MLDTLQFLFDHLTDIIVISLVLVVIERITRPLWLWAIRLLFKTPDEPIATRIERGEKFLRFRFLLPLIAKIGLCYVIVNLYFQAKQFQKCVDLAGSVKYRGTPKSTKMLIDCNKAEALEALGNRGEADALWAQLGQMADNLAGTGWDCLLARAEVYRNTNRRGEAYPIYQQTLQAVPLKNQSERELVLNRLVSMSSLSGNNSDTLHWATEMLKVTQAPRLRFLAYFQAGLGCKELDKYDDAERYMSEAVNVARAANMKVNLEIALARLGAYAIVRGNLETGFRLLDEAEAVGSQKAGTAKGTKSDVLYTLGKMTEGLRCAQEAVESTSRGLPSEQRLTTALRRLTVVRGYCHLGQGDLALDELAKAEPELSDMKMRAAFLPLKAWALALCGENAKAREIFILADGGRQSLHNDNSIQKSCLNYEILAALALKDYKLAWNLAEQREMFGLPKASLAFVAYAKGRCAKELGDTAQANEFFQKAATVHPLFYYSQLASRELGNPVSPLNSV